MTMMRALSASIALCAALAAAPARAETPSAEAFTYQFSVGPIEGGRARLAIGKPFDRQGLSLIAARGEAETAPWLKNIAPLRDEYQVLMAAQDQLPVDVATIETGMKTRKTKSVYDVTGKRVEVAVDSPKLTYKRARSLPGAARDPVSLYLHLRKQPLKNGDTVTLHLLDRSFLSRVTFKVLGREPIYLETARMKGRAIKMSATSQRIDDAGNALQIPARPFFVWMSDDADRVLLRMEVDAEMGKANIELTSYSKAGRGATN